MYFLQESKFKLVAYWCKNEIADNRLKKKQYRFFQKNRNRTIINRKSCNFVKDFINKDTV